MSKTVRISPLLVLISVLVGASIGSWVGGLFGGFVAALLAIPFAGAFQVITREAWRLTAPPPQDKIEAEAIIGAAGPAATEAARIAELAERADGLDRHAGADDEAARPSDDAIAADNVTVGSGEAGDRS
jgi:hypothetical protein